MAVVKASPYENPIQFAAQALLAAFVGEPAEQMVWSFILGGIAYISALFSFGATVFLVAVFAVTFLVGLSRLLFRRAMEVM